MGNGQSRGEKVKQMGLESLGFPLALRKAEALVADQKCCRASDNLRATNQVSNARDLEWRRDQEVKKEKLQSEPAQRLADQDLD